MSPETAANSNAGLIAKSWAYLKQSFSDWSRDNASRLAAALAFWTMLSIAPLLIVCLKITGMVFGEQAARGQLTGYLSQSVGSANAKTLQDMIQSAGEQGSGIFATIFSIALLVWSASNVFVELQQSLNTLWEVKPDPKKGWMKTIKERAFSMALVMSIAFLLLVSLVISTVLSNLTKGLGAGEVGWLMELAHSVVAIAVITALFAMMFKYLPDVKIAWRDVWIGAIVTAILFTIGKLALGWYLGRESATSVYGAAGSIVALLLWVYYSALILFFGVEFTQVYAKAHNRGLVTARGAQPATDDARAQEGLAPKHGGKPREPYGQPKPAWQRYDSKGPGSRVVTIERPAPGTKKAFTIAGAGLATGAALAAVGWLSRKDRAGDAEVQRRIAAVQTRMQRVEDFSGAARHLSIAERVAAVDHRLSELASERSHPQVDFHERTANGRHLPARVMLGDVARRFVSAFERGRTSAAEPRGIADRLRQWIGV